MKIYTVSFYEAIGNEQIEMNENIVDELLTQARIYLDEQAEMVIDTVQEYDNVADSCLKCGGSIEEIYARSEHLTMSSNDYDLIVLKCEKCNLFYAFWIQPFTYEPFFSTPAREDEYRGGRRIEPQKWEHVGKPQWGEGKRPKFSKKIAQNYERTASKLQSLNKKVNSVVQARLAEIYRAGLSIETVNSARNKVINYLRKNSVTSKQLVSLFAAAIYAASHEELTGINGFKRVGEKISERQLEKIFCVTRKTIRKWGKHLPRRVNNLYL